MTEPVCAQTSPYGVTVRAGRKYFWCACGRSAKQPFCDGSHAGSDFEPVLFEATANEEIWFCGCKATSSRPLCDGTHNKL
jgi:CDGSH-type Zn-finger protein